VILADAPLELVRLSTAIAEALEARDLDRAEQLLDERGRIFASGPPPWRALDPAARAEVAAAGRVVLDADLRSHAAIDAAISDLGRELGGLATGAAAMRAYELAEPSAPGFVDRRQ